MIRQIRLVKRLGLTTVILFIIAITIVLKGGTKVEDQVQPTMITNYNNVGAIALHNNSGSIGIILDEQGNPAIINGQTDYSPSKLRNFITQLAHITAEKDLGIREDLSQFNLDNPIASAKLIFDSGSTLELFLGMENSIDSNYYLKRSDNDIVYIVSHDIGKQMQFSIDDFRDFELFPGLDRKSLLNLEGVSISSEYGSYKLLREPSETNVALFSLALPVRREIDWQKVDQQVLAPISQLMPTTFVSENESLEKYRLNKPVKTLSLTYAGKTVTVGFSDASEDEYFIADLSKQEVFLCKKEDAAFLQQSYKMLLSDSIYYSNLAEISLITISRNGKRYNMEVMGTGESLKAKTGEKQLSKADADALFSAITTIPIYEEIAGNDQISMQSSLSIIISKRNDTTDIIEFVPLEDSRYAVVVNGQANFCTHSSVVEDILSISSYTLYEDM